MESRKTFEGFCNISLHWLQWLLFIVVKGTKTEELLIPSQEGEMAEEYLVVNCLQLFSVQGKYGRCKRR